MKRIFNALGLMLVSALTLTNCTKNIETPVVESEGVPFEIVASTVETKTVNDGMSTLWAAGDQINVFYAVGETADYVSAGAFTVNNVEEGIFTGTLPSELNVEEEYDWYAMYPYNASLATPENTTVAVSIGTGLVQDGYDSTAHLAGEGFPLYGKAVATPGTDMPSVDMKQLASVLAVNVTNNSGASIQIEEVSFDGGDNNISGTFYVDFSDEKPVYKPAEANSVVTVTVENPTALAVGKTATVYLAIAPFSADEGDGLTLTVNGLDKTVYIEKDIDFVAGKVKTLNFSYEAAVEEDPTGIVTIKSLAKSSTEASFDVVLKDAVVTCVNGSNAYIEESNAGILIYKSNHGLKVGDVLNGKVTGKVKLYNNLREITAIDYSTATKTTTDVIPETVLTIAELNATGAYDVYENMRVKIVNAEVVAGEALSQNESKYDFYKKVTTVKGYDQYNYVTVTGYPSKFYEDYQLNVYEDAIVLGASKTVFSGFGNVEVAVGATKANKATASSGATVTYVSSAPEIATVDENGNVTGVSIGTATVTVSVPAYNNYPAAEMSCTVTVKDAGDIQEVAPYTLSFSSKNQRTSFSTSQQVWEQNGVKLVNDKSSSTSNVADYANPVRFYASSKITVSMEGKTITKIEFTCNSNSYATALKNSIGSTATASGSKVTVELATPASSYVINKLTAQVRMNSLTVYAY